VGVVGRHEDLVSKNRCAAICPEGGVTNQSRSAWARVIPYLATRQRIEGEDRVRAGDVHDPVGNQWRYLQPEILHVLVKVGCVREQILPERHREYPLQLQLVYVGAVDLTQLAVPVGVERSVVSQPVAGLRMQNALEINITPFGRRMSPLSPLLSNSGSQGPRLHSTQPTEVGHRA